jgi:outer membrane autotransporter protein
VTATADVKSIGAQAEGGWSMAVGGSGFVEPLASISYVRTTFDSITLPMAAGVTFDNATSLRASIGVRVGASTSNDNYKLKFNVTGRLWNEFEGDNHVNINSGGPVLRLGDDFGGGFGELSGGANIFSANGNLSAFINGGVKFRSDYHETGITAGFRYQW